MTSQAETRCRVFMPRSLLPTAGQVCAGKPRLSADQTITAICTALVECRDSAETSWQMLRDLCSLFFRLWR